MKNKDLFSETYHFQSTVLIVDDDRQQLEILTDCLEESVSTIITASNGKEALSTAKKELPDIILLDVMMPEMNGFDVCTQLKKDPRTKDIPVIFITALNDLNSILKGFSCGGVDYVSKPYHTKEILSRLNTHIRVQFQQRKMIELSLELKAAKEEAEAARIIAEKANKAKTNFLCNISHELLTPMNMIQSMTHFALDSGLNPKQTEYLQKIKSSSDFLKLLIDDILEYSTIDSGNAIINNDTFEISKVISYVRDILSSKIVENKELQLLISEDPMIPKLLLGDYNRIQRILIHLGDNAIKFTSKGFVKLKVRLLEKNDHHVSISFSVIDTGIGMSESQQEFFFQPFTQANMAKDRKYSGVGIGLALCQQMIKLLKGKFSVSSGPEKGSVVTFQLNFSLPQGLNHSEDNHNHIELLSDNTTAVLKKDYENQSTNDLMRNQPMNTFLYQLIVKLEACLKKRNPVKSEQLIIEILSNTHEKEIRRFMQKIQENVRRYQFKNAQKQLSILSKMINN